jgi:hypothetical protein
MIPPREPMESRARSAFLTYGLPAFRGAVVAGPPGTRSFTCLERAPAVAVMLPLDQRTSMRRLAIGGWLDEGSRTPPRRVVPHGQAELGAPRRGRRMNRHLDDI